MLQSSLSSSSCSASKFDPGLVWVSPGQLHHCHTPAMLSRALSLVFLTLHCTEGGISPRLLKWFSLRSDGSALVLQPWAQLVAQDAHLYLGHSLPHQMSCEHGWMRMGACFFCWLCFRDSVRGSAWKQICFKLSLLPMTISSLLTSPSCNKGCNIWPLFPFPLKDM